MDVVKQDYYTKKLTTESFLKIMLFAQLHETVNLHAISAALLYGDFQKTVCFNSISASQFSCKNNELNPVILATIFLDLVKQIYEHNNQSRK